MKIIIKEREVEYTPDYPEGWKFSAGDPFKFPVLIENYKCFIKRFEKKDPANITGWPLLQLLKGRYEPNLPRVYDIKEVDENGRNIYYVFYEHIDGKTLETAIAEGVRIDLSRLTDDLFSAFQSIHKHQFWFVDFCEKNIFCENEGRYLLVDLDSTDAVPELPNNDMYGSKDYWIPVFQFYKDVLGKNDIKLHDINGTSLNYLQLIFLILRLKNFHEKPGQNYKSDAAYEGLHLDLDKTDPVFRELFLAALQSGSGMLPSDTAEKIKASIHHHVLHTPGSKPSPQRTAVIKKFSANQTSIKKGEAFTLSWDVEEADKIELYRNGELLKTMEPAEKQVQRTEFKDGAAKDVRYELVAYKNGNSVRTKPVIISRKEEVRKKTPLLWVGLLALLVIAAVVFFMTGNTEKERNLSIREGELVENTSFVFYGKDIPDASGLEVLFNDVKGFIQLHTKDSIVVHVPEVEVPKARTEVQVLVKNAADTIFRESLPYIPVIAVQSMEPQSMGWKSQKEITAKGKNLTDAANVRVFFRNLNRPDSVVGTVSEIKRNELKAKFNSAALLGSYAQTTAASNTAVGVSDIVKEGAYYDVLSQNEMLTPETQASLASFYLRHNYLDELQYPGWIRESIPISVTIEIDGKTAFHDRFRYYTLKYTKVDDPNFGEVLRPRFRDELMRVRQTRSASRIPVSDRLERIDRISR